MKIIASARGSCMQHYHYLWSSLISTHTHSHSVLTLAHTLLGPAGVVWGCIIMVGHWRRCSSFQCEPLSWFPAHHTWQQHLHVCSSTCSEWAGIAMQYQCICNWFPFFQYHEVPWMVHYNIIHSQQWFCFCFYLLIYCVQMHHLLGLHSHIRKLQSPWLKKCLIWLWHCLEILLSQRKQSQGCVRASTFKLKVLGHCDMPHSMN